MQVGRLGTYQEMLLSAFNRCFVLFGICCRHFVADMWECCLAFNTLDQRRGYIHCSARGPRTNFLHESLWKRGEHFHVMWLHFQMYWFLVHHLSLWKPLYVNHWLEHFLKWFNWYVFVSDCMQVKHRFLTVACTVGMAIKI
jgi:hypothetical protein